MENPVNSRVLLLKKELGLSNSEFCLQAKISSSTLYSIQNGVDMQSKTINAICTAFNANKAWLLTGEGIKFKEDKGDSVSVDPWRDALVSQLAEENTYLKSKYDQLMVLFNSVVTKTPNFLKASENAYDFMFHLPGVNKYANVSGANHA